MRRRKSALALAGAVAALVALVLPRPAAAGFKQERKLHVAGEVFTELLRARDRGVPEELLERAACIAVIPGVIKGAFGWGGRHGRGALTCRQEGGWSPPVFVTLSGASFGFQIGAEATDVVLFFMSQRSVRSLLKSKFTIGGDATVAAGPVGRSAEAATDVGFRAEIFSYAKSRGLFAGIALEGARLAPSRKWTEALYGKRLWPDEVLFEPGTVAPPPAVAGLLDALP